MQRQRPGCGHKTGAVEKASYRKLAEAGAPRAIPIGAKGLAKQPEDTDFGQAAVYEIDVPADCTGKLLDIQYVGDCARLYADGRLIADNFYNGRPLQYALWRLPESVAKLQLKILPLGQDMPIYFPAEATTDILGEKVIDINISSTQQ